MTVNDNDVLNNRDADVDVFEFIKQFTNESTEAGKQKQINSIITRKYAPVMEKYVALSVGFNKSAVRKDGRIIFNSFLSYINLIMITLKLHTCLALSSEQYNETDCYDALMEHGILPLILSAIGRTETEEINKINEMIISDARDNENTIQSYASFILGAAKDSFKSISDNEEIIEAIKAIK